MGKIELSESQIELQCLDYLVKVRGLLAWKNPSAGYFDTKRQRFRKHASPYARNGVADILCVLNGLLVAFEVKSESGRQSEAQKLFERDLIAAGGRYFIVRSLQDLIDALRSVESSNL